MELDLSKKLEINLSKSGDSSWLNDFSAVLSWDANVANESPYEFDADLTLCELELVGKDLEDQPVMNILANDARNLLFYNNEEGQTVDGAFKHSGDDRDGGKEIISGNISKVNPKTSQIDIVATIYEGLSRHQNWGNLNAKLELIDNKTNKRKAFYDLKNDFATDTAIQFGSFVFKNGDCFWEPVGMGFANGLEAFVAIWRETPAVRC